MKTALTENSFSAAMRLAAGLKVGLLGGSFNPAHDGHLHITTEALKRLGLDQIWWLVSPQNPLKPATDMAPFRERLKQARELVSHPDVKVLGLESSLPGNYSVDTIQYLKNCCPQTRFVWIMAADNFAEFARWHHWQEIMKLLPLAILDRQGWALKSLNSKAAQRFASARRAERRARSLVHMLPPAWMFLTGPRHPASATEIRLNRKPDWNKMANIQTGGPTVR